MKRYTINWRSLGAILFLSTQLSSTAIAEDVILNPAYITGQAEVSTHGQKVRNLSISTSGGGYSSSKSVSQTYAEPIVPLEYSVTLQGGDWETTVNATATSSPVGSSYPYTNIYFSPRTFSIPATEPPTTVENNNYATDATVQFQLSLTPDSDPYTYWYAYAYARKEMPTGEERTYSQSQARDSWCTDPNNCTWDMPVVANSANPDDPNDQGVRIYAYVRVYGTHANGTGYNQYYYFWYYSPDYRYEDIAPGETLVIPLELTHTAPPGNDSTGSVQGRIDLDLYVDGVDLGGKFQRHYVYGYNSTNTYENPGDYLLENEVTGNRTYRARTYWLDEGRSIYLNWPYTDGDSLNDQIQIEPNQIYTKDFSSLAGVLTGQINLTGTLQNDDLNYYQLRSYGACDYRITNPDGSWFYERQPTCGGYSYDTVYGSDADQSYRFFLTPGPWHPYYLQTYAYSNLLGYTNYSQMRIYDYNHLYDGYSYDFGSPSQVLAGHTIWEDDRTYCTGSLIVRFRIAGGDGQLRNPYLSGSANVYDEAGEREFYANIWGYSYPPTTVIAPEVEIHGIPADYNISTVRAYTDDNTQVTFPAISERLECGVRKGRDLSGPEIVIGHPPFGFITNADSVSVEGTATDDTGIDSLDINGNDMAFTSTGNPQDANEVSFAYDLLVVNGINTIHTAAVDLAGNESFDERDIYVDRWVPTVVINSPGNGALSGPSANIDIAVEGADRGYGYDLTVTLDGEMIHEATGMANDTAATSLTFSETHTLGLGAHTITAVVNDQAGNSASDTVTLWVNDPPVLDIDLNTQTVQYGDKISTVTITAEDSDTPPSGMEITWSILPSALVPSGGCTANGIGSSCTWKLDGQFIEMAEFYEISLTVDDGVDPRIIGTEVVVVQEDATATFDDSNPSSLRVVSDGGSSGDFDIIAHVTEAQPDLPVDLAAHGDIQLANVTINLIPVGSGGIEEPTSCNPITADGTVTCSFSGIGVETYKVAVTISGDYYIGSAENVLTVYDPSLGFTTGGGWFYWPGTSDKTNFGYTMKYGKKGKNVKGSLLMIRHLPNDQKYRIKSNSLDGLAIGEDPTVPFGWASFSGKATYLEPGMLEAEGNHGFTVYVEDRNEPGSGNDRVWITTRTKDGSAMPAMSVSAPAPDNAVTLRGGNIVAPH